jgi:hypothetical protein
MLEGLGGCVVQREAAMRPAKKVVQDFVMVLSKNNKQMGMGPVTNPFCECALLERLSSLVPPKTLSNAVTGTPKAPTHKSQSLALFQTFISVTTRNVL